MRLAPSLLLLAALGAAACGDARLDHLSIGISGDSATHAIGDPPHRVATYLSESHQWTVQLYDRGHAGDADSVLWRKMSPVVLIDGKVVGWGWSWWDGAAAKHHLPVPGKS